MANYATNIFHARTENKTDLDKIDIYTSMFWTIEYYYFFNYINNVN